MASKSASACCESLRLAPVSCITSGIPFPSQIKWRLLPGFARSVGLGPVCCPQKQLARNYHPQRLVTTQSARNVPANPATRNEAFAKCQAAANHAAVANSSFLSRSPSPAAASPRESHCALQTEYRRDTHGLVGEVCHPWGEVMWTAALAESDSTKHRKQCADLLLHVAHS